MELNDVISDLALPNEKSRAVSCSGEALIISESRNGKFVEPFEFFANGIVEYNRIVITTSEPEPEY